MNLFAVAVRLMQGDAANLMRGMAHLELGKKHGLPEAHKMVGPRDGTFSKRDKRLKVVTVTGKSQIPDLDALYRILREHVENPTGRERTIKKIEEMKRDAKARGEKFIFKGPIYSFVGLPEETEILTKCLNGPVLQCFLFPRNEGEPWRIERSSAQLRNVAEALVYYLEHFENPDLLAHDPIKICPNCDALFLKVKSSQEFCSTNCRVSAWGKKQGKEYFKQKQAEYRASVKAQEEKLKGGTKRRK